MIVYGFSEMNYVAANIEAVEIDLEDGPEFDHDTGELISPSIGGWYYRTFGQAKKAALEQLRTDIKNLQWTVKGVAKQRKPTKVYKGDE